MRCLDLTIALVSTVLCIMGQRCCHTLAWRSIPMLPTRTDPGNQLREAATSLRTPIFALVRTNRFKIIRIIVAYLLDDESVSSAGRG